MKKRYMEPKNHKAINTYDFNKIHVDTKEFKGYIGSIRVKNSTEDWYVPREDGTQICILKSGYRWLEFYPDNEKYAITAICDENENVIEWYFDMVKSLGVEDGMPYMQDLYLDLVITPNNEIYILDEDELQEAVDIKDITLDDYKLAHKTLDMLLEKYDNGKDISKLEYLTNKYLGEL